MYGDGKEYASGWNFGPDPESIVPVKQIANLVVKNWGQGKWVDLSNKDDFHEANLLSLDCTKAKTYLGWKPRLSIDEAIKYTVEWYKASNEDMHSFNKKQIEDYVSKTMGLCI